MKHSVRHDLDLDTASRAVRVALDSYAERFSGYDPQVQWSGDHRANISVSAKGLTVKGTVEVKASNILIDLEVPFILRVFKKKAISIIEGEIQKWLRKARAGELDG